jgi:hypothetical protein
VVRWVACQASQGPFHLRGWRTRSFVDSVARCGRCSVVSIQYDSVSYAEMYHLSPSVRRGVIDQVTPSLFDFADEVVA